MLTQAPRGTRDVLPQDSGKWQFVESIMREVAALHGLREVRTPTFEHTELFLRSVGDTTDIVQKEMYTFDDKGGRSITLKPEGTAGVVRAFVEHGLFNEAQPLGMYYVSSPVFRYESPQSGRYREHHQFGVEVFGAKNATVDAEVISVAGKVIEKLGIRGCALRINSIGCPVCRPAYQQALRDHFAPHLAQMCTDCKSRFERNPMRLLDCKNPGCQPFKAGAPSTIDCLCGDCSAHFAELKQSLTILGLPFEIDTGIVRGLDYYTRTVFEYIAPLHGREIALAGGGRYDGLVEQIGGPSVPGIGYGSGVERLLEVAAQQGVDLSPPSPFDAIVLSMGDEARIAAFALAAELRAAGVRTTCDHAGRSLKAQIKYAGKMNAPYCAILAPDEMRLGVVKLRDMASSSEQTLPRAEIVKTLVNAIQREET
jgi:histidyl-tRNA synthetase